METCRREHRERRRLAGREHHALVPWRHGAGLHRHKPCETRLHRQRKDALALVRRRSAHADGGHGGRGEGRATVLGQHLQDSLLLAHRRPPDAVRQKRHDLAKLCESTVTTRTSVPLRWFREPQPP